MSAPDGRSPAPEALEAPGPDTSIPDPPISDTPASDTPVSDPWQLLEDASTVLAVHAHPDDESLSSGALLASLAASGTRVVLVTATRGEEGEIVPGALAADESRPLEEIREGEIDAAAAALGIAERHWLGTAPALAPGAAPRRFRDSGMEWVREGLAGPSGTAGPGSFSLRPLTEAVDDLVALLEAVRPDVVIGYDDEGTYGHPDHVRAHHVAVGACTRTGTPLVQIASELPDVPGADPRILERDHPGTEKVVRRAVDSYRTQLTVVEHPADGGKPPADGVEPPADGGGPSADGGGPPTDGIGSVEGIAIRHVGGQDDVVRLRTGLRVQG